MDISLHLTSSHVGEDLEYYFSERRDKHNQIRPSDDIRSFAINYPNFTADPGKDGVGNALYPFASFSLDRIFIGISFPLFSNNWGAAFLRHLLGLIKPQGSIILPVYPEVQARDQGFWCRSSLESIFRSRSRFIGASNIWAENDGVMSMRVGRRWPPRIPSIARWLFECAPSRATALGLEKGSEEAEKFWHIETQRFWYFYYCHAIVEQIIRDLYGPRHPVRLAVTGEDAGILALECLYSPHTRVTRAYVIDTEESIDSLRVMDQACSTRKHGPLEFPSFANMKNSCDVLCVTDMKTFNVAVINHLLAAGGTLILTPDIDGMNYILSEFGHPELYSNLVARRLHPNVPIYHYSRRVKEAIDEQAKTLEHTYAVFRKV